jgi:hypothetical protein
MKRNILMFKSVLTRVKKAKLVRLNLRIGKYNLIIFLFRMSRKNLGINFPHLNMMILYSVFANIHEKLEVIESSNIIQIIKTKFYKSVCFMKLIAIKKSY